MLSLRKAEIPTMYFIGVTTGHSAIMRIFPHWANALHLPARLVGVDLPLNAHSDAYRAVVSFIKSDPLSLGALVTTHKMNMFSAAHDLFDYLDPYAVMFQEISAIAKKNGEIEGYAKDPISSGLAMDSFIPQNYWVATGSEVLILGSGGSGVAIAAALCHSRQGTNHPSRIRLTNHRQEKLVVAQRILSRVDTPLTFTFHLCATPESTDLLVNDLPPYSLVVNATGVGKDQPGSPITALASFPRHGMVWELNYRGTLEFLHQAKRQQRDNGLRVEDGWVYFLHGWTQVIAEVFHLSIDQMTFAKLARLAHRVVGEG